MKVKKKAKKNDFYSEAKSFLALVDTGIIYAFLFCMLVILPLFYENAYQGIGNVKYVLFAKTSKFFLIVEIILIIVRISLIISQYFKGESIAYVVGELKKRSFLDKAVAVYGVCVVISFLLCNDKAFAFEGADGWKMGLYSQLVFVGSYFLISWRYQLLEGILKLHLFSSAIVFILGILHRFQIDPLGMYEGLGMNHRIQFLSTLGQSSWYSSYMCTVFFVGIIIFYLAKKKKVRIWTGIYTVLCFAIFVVQNSDSAYIAIVGILLLLGYFSLENKERWLRFIQLIAMMFGTFAGIGILQKIFATRVVPLESLSIFFSQSIFTWIILAISIGLYFLFKNLNEEKIQKFLKIFRKLYKLVLVLLVLGIVGMIVFIYLNTKGYLLQWFGYQNTHSYLLFDNHWGNNRGSTWMISWQTFMQLPFYQKLFGVGPDSLSAYLYSVPEISDLLHSLWGNVRLTNAHNEYLNSLLCYGLVGLSAWLTVLIGGIAYFYKKAKDNPFMIAFALCIMGYACHNIFCYQQVCCTPFLFIALGIGESLTKSENLNTIK